VDFIIQYDPPTEISDYVHRIGRTARKGSPGTALLFLSPNEADFLGHLANRGLNLTPLSLEATLQRALKPSSASSSSSLSSSKRGVGGGSGGGASSGASGGGWGGMGMLTSQSLDEHLQKVVEKQHSSSQFNDNGASVLLKDLAHAAFQSFIRAYSIHRFFFHHAPCNFYDFWELGS